MTTPRFHMKKDGSDIGICKAKEGRCPLGPAAPHYDTPEAAYKGFKKQFEKDVRTGDLTFSKPGEDKPTASRVWLKREKDRALSEVWNRLEIAEKSLTQRKKEAEDFERELVKKFVPGERVVYQGEQFTVESSAKPVYRGGGEGKTDIYLRLRSESGESTELKLSLKKDNASFLENKVNLDRALAIFGSEERFRKIADLAYGDFEEKLKKRQIDFDEPVGNVKAGSHTIGYRLDITNQRNGELSSKLDLTEQELLEIYAGAGLEERKRNGTVDGATVTNSGVASHFLKGKPDEVLSLSPSEILNEVVPIEKYVNENPEVWIKLAAVNYRKNIDKMTQNSHVMIAVNRETGVYERVDLKKRASEYLARELDALSSAKAV